jgi:hypothetical protein
VVLERRVAPDGRRESLDEVTTRLMLLIAALLPVRHRGAYDPLLGAAGPTAGDAGGGAGEEAGPLDAPPSAGPPRPNRE